MKVHKNRIILGIVVLIILISIISLYLLGSIERKGYIEVVDIISADKLVQSSWTDHQTQNGVIDSKKLIFFDKVGNNDIIIKKAKYLKSGNEVFKISKIDVWGAFEVYLDTTNSIKSFEYPNKIDALDANKQPIQNIYHVRIRYYSKIFRNSDIYGVYPLLNKIDNSLKNIDFEGAGSPYAHLLTYTEFNKGDNVGDIYYRLKVKPVISFSMLLISFILIIVIILPLNFKKIIKLYFCILPPLTIVIVILGLLGNKTRNGYLDKFELLTKTKAGYVYKASIADNGLFSPNKLFNLSKKEITFVDKPEYIINDGYIADLYLSPAWYDTSVSTNWKESDGSVIFSNAYSWNAFSYIVPVTLGDKYKISIEARALNTNFAKSINWDVGGYGYFIPIEGSENITSEYQVFTDTVSIDDSNFERAKKATKNLHIHFPENSMIQVKSIKIEQVSGFLKARDDNSIVFTSSRELLNTDRVNILYGYSLSKNIIVLLVLLWLILVLSKFYKQILFSLFEFQENMSERKFIFITVITAFMLLIFQFWLGFPGYFQNPDNCNILSDSIRGIFGHWHPAGIAKTLNILYFFFGEHTFYIFLINLLCWYSGLSLIIIALYLKSRKIIVYTLFILTFIANIFFSNFTQLKDITFGMYVWLGYSLIFFQIITPINKKYIRVILKSLTFMSLFLALLWRHNAIVTIYPIFILFTYLLLKNYNFKNIFHYLRFFSIFMLLFAFLLVGIIKIYPRVLIKNYRPVANLTNIPFILQIAACAVESNDDSLIPKEWYIDGKDFEYLKEIYKLYTYNGNIHASWGNPAFKLSKLKNIEKVWGKYILKYPKYYVNWIINFGNNFWFASSSSWVLSPYALQSYSGLGYFPENERKVTLTDAKLSIYDFLYIYRFYLNNFVGISISILIFILSGLICIFNKKSRSTLLIFSFATAFSSFATAIIVVLFSPGPDDRYIYPVLPIAIVSLISFFVFLIEEKIFINKSFKGYKMRKLKILLDKYILTKIEKINPILYRFLTYDCYRIYSEFYNFIKYKDRYFFHSISIEISTFCNRKCDYCPNKFFETPRNFMTEEIFKKIISDLKAIKYDGILQYHFFNEPLFDDRLETFVEYVKKELPNCIQVLISNGDILETNRAANLINCGIDKFVVTVHDRDPTRGLERLQPVKNLLKEKMRLQSSADLELANRGGAIDVSKHVSKKEFKKCPNILTAIITLNGDMILCCQDYHKKHVMGNLMEQSIMDIWKSYSNLRYDLLKKNKVDLNICKKCLDRK